MLTIQMAKTNLGHVQGLLDCEEKLHGVLDDDMGVMNMPRFVWDKDQILQAGKGKLSKSESRLLVLTDEDNVVRGGMYFELLKDRYAVKWMTMDPDYEEEVQEALFVHLLARMDSSLERRVLEIFVPDDFDQGKRYYERSIGYYQEMGAKVERGSTNANGFIDTWKVTYKMPVLDEETSSI